MEEDAALIDRRVYVIDDDDPLARATIRRMLTGSGVYSEEFESAGDFLQKQPDLPMGCILLNLRLHGIGGLRLLKQLKDRGVPDPVIMISGQVDVPEAVEAIKSGAIDFIEKPFRKERLLDVVNKAFDLVRSHQQRENIQRSVNFSGREQQVLNGLAEGATNKLIARQLGISSRTVEMHRAKIMRKLGVKTAAHAVLVAREAGFLG